MGWDRVVVYRFPLTADASKVPGDSQSFYSVGLNYGEGESREEWEMEEWETRRGKERSTKGCPELSSEERMAVWLDAQHKLKEEAEEKEECRESRQVAADRDKAMEKDADDGKEPAKDAVSAKADASTIDITASDDMADHPVAAHSHNLRKRHPPPSSALPATAPPATAKTSSPPPLLFSDVSDLTSLRSSRARVGCSCTVPAGDRQTKVCTAPWLQQSKRASHRHKHDDEQTTATTQSSTDSSSDDHHDSDYMAGHDTAEVLCECLRAGVGCNSNTCSCYSYCCRNPYERYLFNAGKVNAKRRKMLAGIKESREGKGGKAVPVDGGPDSAGHATVAKGKSGHVAKRRGRKRAQSV